MASSAEGGGDDQVAKRQRTDGAEDGGADASAASTSALADDDSAANLEASLQSCMAHRDRILAMLNEEPDNRNLIELRDQLTNAINQLQGTKNMVQLARTGRQGVAGQPIAADGTRPAKGHSSRKNKPQRCSVCGGIGHKSRTCSMAVTPNAQQMCQPVQWAAATPGGMPAGVVMPNADPSHMYAAVNGGYVMVNGQPGGAMQPMQMSTCQIAAGQMAGMMGQPSLVAMQPMGAMQQLPMGSMALAGGLQQTGLQLAPGAVMRMATVDDAATSDPVVSAVAEAPCCFAGSATAATVPIAIHAAVPTAVAAVPAELSGTTLEVPSVAAAGGADEPSADRAKLEGEAAEA